MGHVKPKKGILEIIEAASMEEDIRFHLVGPVSDEIKKVYAPKNIVFYGRKAMMSHGNNEKGGCLFVPQLYRRVFYGDA